MYLKDKKDDENRSDVIFEFYAVGISYLEEDSENDSNSFMDKKEIQIDFENLWILIMKVAVLFEDMVSNLPSKFIIYMYLLFC
jgi:hypothetical protein